MSFSCLSLDPTKKIEHLIKLNSQWLLDSLRLKQIGLILYNSVSTTTNQTSISKKLFEKLWRTKHPSFFIQYDLPSHNMKCAIQKCSGTQENNDSPKAASYTVRSVSPSLCGTKPLTRQFPIIEASRHSSRGGSLTVSLSPSSGTFTLPTPQILLLLSALIRNHISGRVRLSVLGSVSCC